jgi:conjugal transfer pilus assembly protein TraU
MRGLGATRIGGLLLALAMAGAAQGAGGSVAAGALCNDPGFASVVSKVCIPCYFPITVGAAKGREVPLSATPLPSCICPGRLFGKPTKGMVASMWQPFYIVEETRAAYCSPILGKSLAESGQGASTVKAFRQGNASSATNEDGSGVSYYNTHVFKFPLSAITDQITDSVCVGEGASDASIAWISEIDPTHTNDTLAMYTTPEAFLFTSVVAQAACIADAVAASVYQPIDVMGWCFGSWGSAYPHSGFIGQTGWAARDAQASAARLAASLHRRGLLVKSHGMSAVCSNHKFPNIVKTQYKLQGVHPWAEVSDNHWIGESPYLWNSYTIPSVGEDHVNLIWSYEQCCTNP